MSKHPEPPPSCPRCKDASQITIVYRPEVSGFKYWCRVCYEGFKYWCRVCYEGFN